jgi:sporulation protein YlmC with PRC-barrel domain
MRLSDQTLNGRTVVAADGLAIGEVTAIFLDSVAWRVESLQIRLRRDIADRLGTPKSLFRGASLELPVGVIQSVGDAVVLSVRVNDLRPPSSPAEEQPTQH